MAQDPGRIGDRRGHIRQEWGGWEAGVLKERQARRRYFDAGGATRKKVGDRRKGNGGRRTRHEACKCQLSSIPTEWIKPFQLNSITRCVY